VIDVNKKVLKVILFLSLYPYVSAVYLGFRGIFAHGISNLNLFEAFEMFASIFIITVGYLSILGIVPLCLAYQIFYVGYCIYQKRKLKT